jgi:hypothetical protein
MKHIQTLALMALCGVALMFANSVSAQSTKQGIVTVVRIQGEARYTAGDNVWHPLVAGKILRSGAVIQSAADSTVDIVLGVVPVQVAYPNSTTQPAGLANAADPNVRGYIVYNPKVSQNVIRMYGNTVLAVDKLTLSDTGVDAVGDTELDLRAGKIFLTVKKLSAMSQFEVKIPNGVAGIRGSGGTIEVKPDGNTIVQWKTGQLILALTGSNGQQMGPFTIDGGFGYNSQMDTQPVPLSPGVLTFLGQLLPEVITVLPPNKVFVNDYTKCYISPVLN